MATGSRRFASLGYMVASAVGFAIMNACAKEASSRLSFLEVAFARSAIGAVAVVLWARASGISLAVKNKRVMLLRVTSGTIAMTLTFAALAWAPLAESSALLNTTPLFVLLLAAVWLRERAGALVVVALLLGFVGALVVFRPGGTHLGRGGLAAIGAALTSAVAMTSLRRLGATETSEAVVAAFLTVGSVATGLAMLPFFLVPTPREALLLVVAGLSATFAQVTMTKAYAGDLAARVGGMNYLHILVSLAFATALFGERPDGVAWIGIALILLSGVGLVLSTRGGSAEVR